MQWRVAQHRAPEPEMDLLGFRGDGKLHLLHRARVRNGAVLACYARDFPRNLYVPLFGSPHLASELDREAVGRDGQSVRGSSPGTSAIAAASCAEPCSDVTLNTAVGPPWRITQSSTPSAARKARHPSSLMK